MAPRTIRGKKFLVGSLCHRYHIYLNLSIEPCFYLSVYLPMYQLSIYLCTLLCPEAQALNPELETTLATARRRRSKGLGGLAT